VRKFFFGFLALGIFAPLVFAEPQLKIEPPAKKISKDQTAVLKICLEWPQTDGPYEINSLEPKLENLTLEKQNQSQETGASISHTIIYEFRPVKEGAAVIYPFEINYRRSETEPWTPLLVPEQDIEVRSNIPVKIALFAIAILAGLSALTAGGFKAWQALRSCRDAKKIAPPDPKQHLYAKAEEAITTFASPDPKEKLTHWSHQFQKVVAAYYDAPREKTDSAALLSFLKTKGLQTGEWNEISGILNRLSEMQFSRQDIPAYELDRVQKTLLQYIKGKIIIGNSNS